MESHEIAWKDHDLGFGYCCMDLTRFVRFQSKLKAERQAVVEVDLDGNVGVSSYFFFTIKLK